MRRILIVDDESSIRGLLSAIFETAGYEVRTASSGEEAIALCESATFDAILSDVTMPGIDGHQTVSRVRALMPGIVAVLMSGFHMACTGDCGLAEKHCTWLQKPLQNGAALTAVEQALAGRPGTIELKRD